MSPIALDIRTNGKTAEDHLRLRCLTFDAPNQRYLLRFSLDLGPARPAKRVTVALRTAHESEAIRQREAVMAALEAMGLTIKQRSLVPKGGRA